MIVFAFALFAVLLVAWVAAPAVAKNEAKAAAPVLKMSESPA